MILTITGPRSVGKTTVSKLVAKKLKLKFYSSDEIGEKALKKQGGLDKAIKSGKIEKLIKSSAYDLIRKTYEKDNFVFDLSGGSVTSRKYPQASEKVRQIANKKSIVIGLLPSKNNKESINFLFEREKEREHFKDLKKAELFEKVKKDYKKFPPLFKRFCNSIIYVENKSPEELADEMVNRIKKFNF